MEFRIKPLSASRCRKHAGAVAESGPSMEVFPAPCVPPWHPRPSLRLMPTAVSELGVGQAEAAADCEGVGGRPEFLELVRPPFVGERADAVAPAESLEASLHRSGCRGRCFTPHRSDAATSSQAALCVRSSSKRHPSRRHAFVGGPFADGPGRL